MSNSPGIPTSWQHLSLQEVRREKSEGLNPAKSPEQKYELYSIPAHESLKPEIITGKAIGSNKQIVKPGMVLISKINPRINRVWVVGSHSDYPKIASTEWVTFDVTEGLVSDYLAYYLQRNEIRTYLAQNVSGVGGSLTRVRPGIFDSLHLPLAPIEEQKRLVAKLDELFSDLDAATAALERVQANLKRYRASVLKSAVEGRLTAEWRAKNPPKETGAQLLERILKERRAKWEENQLAKFKAQGKEPPKDWQKKYPEPVKPDTTNLPELPEGWVWASLEMITTLGPQNGLYMPQSAYGSGVPILRIDDFQNGWSRSSEELRKVKISQSDLNTYTLRIGDLVINRVNSPTHLGKCLIVETRNLPSVFESNMMRLEMTTNVSAAFITRYLQSDAGRSRLIKDAKWAVNQASINQQDVLRCPVPIPPVTEQAAVCDLLDEQGPFNAQVQSTLSSRISHCNNLRQSILKEAFGGKLVPQDPNDEPASELLRRIREAREQQEAAAAGAKQERKAKGVVSKKPAAKRANKPK